jgi:hypothetical protein
MLPFMEANSQFLPPDIEAAVEAQHGGPVSVSGQHGKYVVMNIDVYGGVLESTPEELAESVAAIKRSLAQAAAGQIRDVDDSLDELEARYGSKGPHYAGGGSRLTLDWRLHRRPSRSRGGSPLYQIAAPPYRDA